MLETDIYRIYRIGDFLKVPQYKINKKVTDVFV